MAIHPSRERGGPGVAIQPRREEREQRRSVDLSAGTCVSLIRSFRADSRDSLLGLGPHSDRGGGNLSLLGQCSLPIQGYSTGARQEHSPFRTTPGSDRKPGKSS